MRLRSIRLQNYRGFSGREEVALAPLTILIGRNNSGKSTIARLPLLLSRAFATKATAPIDLAGDAPSLGGSFLDLVHNRFPHGSIRLGATLQNEADSFEISAAVQHFAEYMLQIVTEFEFRGSEGPVLRLKWAGGEPMASPLKYELVVRDGEPIVVPVHFTGLLPNLRDLTEHMGGVLYSILWQLFDSIRESFDGIGYLGPFRSEPRRLYSFPGGLPEHVGLSGIAAPALLGADHLRRGGVILAAVSDWYAKHLGGWGLGITRQGDAFSLVLTRATDPSLSINLADAGTGLSQVLPLVVQRRFEALTNKRTQLEIVEQPELHLHPAAHAGLADLYADAVSSETNFIVETHSETFLLRLRRRVAEGKLDPKNVRIYWVDESAEPPSRRIIQISINRDGGVSEWPQGVFSEDFEEVRAIRAAQERQ